MLPRPAVAAKQVGSGRRLARRRTHSLKEVSRLADGQATVNDWAMPSIRCGMPVSASAMKQSTA